MLRRFLSTANRKPVAVRKSADEARRAVEKAPDELQGSTSSPSPEVPPSEPQSFGHYFASNFIWGAGAMVGALAALNIARAFMDEVPPSESESDEWLGAQHVVPDK
ncbi:hypothetical protein LEN26_011320 [Aphanomyces euteiches]|nr:hypothetical protein AeMF1_018904 [Aphanomyces euteiches]KAH9120017.1 hypothetical protein LEN26_011320 [Aphanomyces euteiches]KAH9188845.1 hypothetical protein AeNC1_009177 [Aphanomyces euteiches]